MNKTLTFLITFCFLLSGASALTIYVRDAATNTTLNSTLNITYNQYYSYQEQANVSTSTGGVSTGTYGLESYSGGSGILNVTYTKTAVATGMIWQTLYGLDTVGQKSNISNYTVPQSCWDSFTDKVQLRFNTTATVASGRSYGQCYNTSASWQNITNISFCGGSSTGNSGSLGNVSWRDGLYNDQGTYAYVSGSSLFYDLTKVAAPGCGGVQQNNMAAVVNEEGAYWNHPYQQVTQTATNGIATITNSTYYLVANITATAPGYSNAITNNIPMNATTYYINLSVNNNNTFYFYDEITQLLITGINVSISATSTVNASNTTTTNGSATISNLTFNLYTITYSAPGYNQRQYTTFLPISSTTTIPLYLRSTALSQPVLLQVVNQAQQKVNNATVYMNKKNLTGNNDYIVEMCVTDINGQCIVSADVTTTTTIANTTYRFIVIYNARTVGDSGYTKISTTANSACNSYLPCVQLQATLATNPLQTFFNIANMQYNTVSYTRSSNIFSFSVVDTTATVQTVCLKTVVRAGATYLTTNSTCSTSAATTITLFSNASLGDETTATGYIVANDGTTILISTLSVANNDSGGVGNVLFFLFVGLLFLGTMFFSYKLNASLAILMVGGMSVILFYISSFPLITNSLIVGGAIIILVVIARTRE